MEVPPDPRRSTFLTLGRGGRLTGGENNLGVGVGILTRVQEYVEHELRIGGAAHCLRMELGSKVRSGLVSDALVGSVVRVREQSLPPRLEGLAINVIAVILGGYVALSRLMIEYRLILSPIAKGYFFSYPPRRQSHELIPKTYAKYGLNL